MRRLYPLSPPRIVFHLFFFTLDWEATYTELQSVLAPTPFALACDDICPREAGATFSALVSAHLESWGGILPSVSSNTKIIMGRVEFENVKQLR